VAVPAYSFSWSAPPECPTETEVAAEVAQLLEPGPTPSAHVTARAVVRHDADGQWHVELTTLRDGEEGARSLVAPSCRSLADATALIVALTIDPARAARLRPAVSAAAEPNVAPAAAHANPGAPQAPAEASHPQAPAEASRARTPAEVSHIRGAAEAGTAPRAGQPGNASWALALAAVGDVGRLPGPSLGGRLAGAWIAGAWRLEAYGFAWGLPTRSAPTSSSSIGADIEMFGGGATACVRVLHSWVEVAPCLGAELGDVHGRGFGVQNPQSEDRAWVAATAAVRAAIRISGPVYISGELGAVFPFAADSFQLDQIASVSEPFEAPPKTVYSPAAVQGRAALGVEVRLPR
jgi:hypothetical protein